MLVFHGIASHREDILSWKLKNRAHILNAIPRIRNAGVGYRKGKCYLPFQEKPVDEEWLRKS